MTTPTSAAMDYLAQLAAEGFWGRVDLTFQRGEVVHLRKEESLKPEELRPGYRRENVESNHR